MWNSVAVWPTSVGDGPGTPAQQATSENFTAGGGNFQNLAGGAYSYTSALDPGDALLLGVDLVKDEPSMIAAYSDAAGITAKFNLNILRIINRELDADIPLDAFEHMTRFDKQFSCIASSLRAKREITANIKALDLAVTFLEGEEIHTEVSCKFTREQVVHDFGAAGLKLDSWLTDSKQRFALALASHA